MAGWEAALLESTNAAVRISRGVPGGYMWREETLMRRLS